MEKIINELQTEMATYFLDEEGILHVAQKKVEINDKIIEENFQRVCAFLDDRKYLIFCDATNSLPIDRKARLAFDEQSERFCLALAIVSDSVLGRAVANVFLALTQSIYPMKLFKNKEEAIKWLKAKA